MSTEFITLLIIDNNNTPSYTVTTNGNTSLLFVGKSALKSQQAELVFNGLLASLQITKNTQLIPMAKAMYLDIILKN